MILSRRSILSGLPALLSGSTNSTFRLAICSETFPGQNFSGICAAAHRTGYSGLEIDPANLDEDPASLSAARRKECRTLMADAGIEYVGLHSFLKTPKGLHLTSPDDGMRRRTWEYFERLIDLSADLGPGSVMVLGSSKQRSSTGKASVPEATARLAEGLAKMAPIAAARGVTVLLEPLSPQFTDVVNTLEAAVDIVRKVGNPGLASMFDTHNTTAETQPASVLIAKHLRHIRHVHLNEMDGRYPGSGDYPFQVLLQALHDNDYKGWLSVELFDFKPDGETVAGKSSAHIRALERVLKT